MDLQLRLIRFKCVSMSNYPKDTAVDFDFSVPLQAVLEIFCGTGNKTLTFKVDLL